MSKNKSKIVPIILLASSFAFTNCEVKKIYGSGEVVNINADSYEVKVKDFSNQEIIIKLKGNKKNLDNLLNSEEGIKIGDSLEFPIGQTEKPIISRVSVYNPYIKDKTLSLKYNQIKRLK